MKLVRFGQKGSEKPGIVDKDGKIRDLTGVVADIDGSVLGPDGLAKLAKLDPASLPLAPEGVRIGPSVGKIGKLIAIGLNFSDHAAETGAPIPKEPIVFMKATSSICGPNDDVEIPRNSVKTDWEVELGIVIGTRAKYIASKDKALDHVAGYVLINDVSEREFQTERGGQWTKGKSHDTFAPIGPWLVTKDEVGDVQKLGMWLEVDGERRQTGNTDTMIFDCAHIVHYLSQFMTLEPGDVITTGTPPGVGMGMKPPLYLKPGQTIRLGIDKLGEQQQKTVQA